MFRGICEICGKEFISNGNASRYCKSSIISNCKYCNKHFTHLCGDKKVYCSRSCKSLDKANKEGKIKKCEACGNDFIQVNPRYRFCKQEKVGNCPVCGEPVTYICGDKVKCCSKPCTNRYKSLRMLEVQSNKFYKHICYLCGKEFYDNRKPGKYHTCNETHYRKCKVCGKMYELLPPYLSHTCSSECRAKITRDSNRLTNKIRQEKRRNTCLEKYGVDSYSKTDEFKEKLKNTCLSRYGVTSYTKTKECRIKQNTTCIKKYGVDNYSKTDEFKIRIKNTTLKKYGTSNVSNSLHFLKKVISDSNKAEELFKFKENPVCYIQSNFVESPTLRELSKCLGIKESSAGDLIHKFHLEEYIKYVYSYMEDSVYEYLLSIDSKCNIERNTYKILKKYELDLYLPIYRLGIECNPTYTHNSDIGIRGNTPKSVDYHRNKSAMSANSGVFLFHIFGYEWTNNQDIIKSMLSSLLLKNPRKVYARNCTLKQISEIISDDFLRDNHLDGESHSQYNYGLYHDDELLQVITFSDSIDYIENYNNMDDAYQLTRICSKKYVTVVGGVSKLFKYFVRTINPSHVLAFSDISHTDGNVYKFLGFRHICDIDPMYHLVHPINDDYITNCELDNDWCLEGINIEKYVKVYNSGYMCWEWSS